MIPVRQLAARLLAWLGLTLAAAGALPSALAADSSGEAIVALAAPCTAKARKTRPGDELFLVSTRGLGCPSGTGPVSLRVARWQGEGWTDDDVPGLLDALAPDLETVVYVHGNRVSSYDAAALGWAAYRGLTRHLPADRPVRMIVWSWPSDRQRGMLQDARAKAARTATDAYYLAWLLAQFPAEARVRLTGFSYGGRIVTGALATLAGGLPGGWELPAPLHGAGPTNFRVVLHSPAIDNTWLASRGHHAALVERVERLTVLYNPCDPALRRFRYSTPCGRPEALGYTGFAAGVPAAGAGKMFQRNVGGHIGKSHSSYDYLHSAALMAITRDELLPPAQ